MKVQTLYGPPGTGKTTSLVEIAELELGKYKHKVTYLSYSKAAAREATSRIENPDMTVSTIHSIAFKIMNLSRGQVVDKPQLKKFGHLIGIPFSGAEANTDEEQQEGDEYMSVVAYAANTQTDRLAAYERAGSPGQVDRFVMFAESYVEWKDKNGLIDFEDMLVLACKRKMPNIEVIILDEAQDCTPLQWNLLKLLAKDTKRVYVAGDDDQAIFEWNGADPHGMASFTEENGGKARVLDQSYRVPREVHKTSMKVINQVLTRVEKQFRPRGEDGVVIKWDSVDQLASFTHTDVMYLARDRFRLKEIKDSLDSEMVPYTVNGSYSNWDNKYARAIKAIYAINHDEECDPEWMKSLKTVTKPGVTSYSGDWRKIIEVPVWLRSFYENADLQQPICTRVSTIHQAKGQEADVIVVDLEMSSRGEREIYAGQAARDAELRVWYVAMTRARKELHLCGENPLIVP